MALSLVAVGAKITAVIANAIIGAVNAGGLSLVAPASVNGTGTAMTALGKVTFAGATAVSLNGCFTTAYDNYLIKIDATMAASSGVSMILRASSANVGGANYDTQLISGVGAATPTSAQALAGTSWTLSAASGLQHNISIELDGPALAQAAFGVVTAASTTNPMTTAAAVGVRQIMNRLTSPVDGFQLGAGGSTMSGVVRVYGYNNG